MELTRRICVTFVGAVQVIVCACVCVCACVIPTTSLSECKCARNCSETCATAGHWPVILYTLRVSLIVQCSALIAYEIVRASAVQSLCAIKAHTHGINADGVTVIITSCGLLQSTSGLCVCHRDALVFFLPCDCSHKTCLQHTN